jgi:hypothetical protein
MIVLALLLLALGALRLSVRIGPGPYGQDGSNYFQLARNVAEGRGLVTSVSLYYEGHTKLPAKSMQTYPLWPWVLGYTGRAIGMHRAAALLPKLLYFPALLLAYAVANAVARALAGRVSIHPRVAWIDFGHLAVLLLGLNEVFFRSTTYPYTEGLAFALMFAAFAVLAPYPPSLARAALSALFAGLAFLTRTQMAIVGPAILLALFVAALLDRRLWRTIPAFVAVGGVFVALWMKLVRNVAPPRAGIEGFAMWVRPSSAADFLGERLTALGVSLDAFGSMSYFYLFGPAAAIPLFALIVFVFRLVTRRVAWRRIAEGLVALAPLIAGLGFFVSLNLYHTTYMAAWLFGYRHGLPYLLLILIGIPYVIASEWRLMRVVAVLFVALSVVIGAVRVFRFANLPQPRATAAEAQVSEWLEKHPTRPTVLTTNAQQLSVWSHANFHWIICHAPASQTRLMIEKLPIDYLLIYDADRRCAWTRGLGDIVEGRYVFGDREGQRIWVAAVRRR